MPEKKIPVYQLNEFDPHASDVCLYNFSAKAMVNHVREVSKPHRHDHYCCFFLESGSIDFNIDFQPVQVTKKSLLVSYPGQIHQLVSFKNCRGWLLSFDPKLVNENARMIIEESLTRIALLKIDDAEHDWFKNLFGLIHSAVNKEKDNLFKTQLTRALLDSFIYKAAFFHQLQENSRVQHHASRIVNITKKFRQLLKKNFKLLKKPSEYAEKMNLSVSYLNDSVKTVTGFPLTYFIQQEIMSEAQRLLHYSEMSVKEIAYTLGYEDPKYFIRLFGKMTGVSPSNFRKQK